jgi:peptide/nickel transport system permease protein
MSARNSLSSSPMQHKVGAALLVLLALVALMVPWLVAIDPRVQDLDRVREAPSIQFWLGTDHLGRDQLVRLAHAMRLSLILALVTVLTAALVGCALGVAAAWMGGRVNRLLQQVASASLAMPGLLVVLLVAAIAPGNIAALYGGLVLVSWVEYFRVTRAMSEQLLASDAVQASKLLGFGRGHIIRRHWWPQLAPVLLTIGAFGAANAVLAMSALGFVGVGLQPPQAELGVMLIELLPYWAEAPWLLAGPTVVLLLVTAALFLLADRERQ